MGSSCMEFIYVGRGKSFAYKTGVILAGPSNAATWRTFRGCRRIEVDRKKATFLLDYYNAKGDLADTVFLGADGFRLVASRHPKTAAEYRRIDRLHWKRARARYEAEKARRL